MGISGRFGCSGQGKLPEGFGRFRKAVVQVLRLGTGRILRALCYVVHALDVHGRTAVEIWTAASCMIRNEKTQDAHGRRLKMRVADHVQEGFPPLCQPSCCRLTSALEESSG